MISGDSLFAISLSSTLKQRFAEILSHVKVLIACRMSPKQKAEIVLLLKELRPNAGILAVGDGANDVSMIT